MKFNLKDVPCIVALHKKLQEEGKPLFILDQECLLIDDEDFKRNAIIPLFKFQSLSFYMKNERETVIHQKCNLDRTLDWKTSKEDFYYWLYLHNSLLDEYKEDENYLFIIFKNSLFYRMMELIEK